jgi:hypothetical protein
MSVLAITVTRMSSQVLSGGRSPSLGLHDSYMQTIVLYSILVLWQNILTASSKIVERECFVKF